MCRRIRAIGFIILHLDRPMTGYDLAMTRFSQYWRRAIRTGYAYAEVSARFRNSDLPLWNKEARHNLAYGAGLLGMVIGVPLISLAMRSTAPLAAAAAVLAALAIRTAIRVRSKTTDRGALLCTLSIRNWCIYRCWWGSSNIYAIALAARLQN